MSKNKPTKTSTNKNTPVAKKKVATEVVPATKKETETHSKGVLKYAPTISKWYPYIIAAIAFIIYANTLSADYCQDDSIVITDNMFTTQGISGFGGILNYDTFYGFFKEAGKENLVAGGRYRPFSLLTFAFEYQFFGANPFISHLVNILLFALTGVLLYKLLSKLLWNWSLTQSEQEGSKLKAQSSELSVAFLAALLFVVHPIHTEAVANIKGRDEILALLLSLYAVWLTIKYFETPKVAYLIGAGFSFLCAVLSKENAITFVVLAPVTLYFFYNFDFKKLTFSAVPFLAAAFVFLLMRSNAIGNQFGSEQKELMNNPFLVLSGGQYVAMPFAEKLATIVFTLGKYMQLLIFPNTLTHDYYPRHIAAMQFADISVLSSALLYIALFGIVILGWRRRSIWSYSAFFYLATLFIVSNIVFPVGTNMAERFIFTPSVGFCIAAAFALYHYLFPKYRNIFYAFTGVLVLGFSVKTIARNFAWRDNYTLFTTDIAVSKNSAKLQCSVGGALIDSAKNVKDEPTRRAMLNEAIPHLKRALEIHPQFSNPYLLQGNAYSYLNNLDSAIFMYREGLKLYPQSKDLRANLALVLRDKGTAAGKQNNLPDAINFLTESAQINPNDGETFSSLGTAYGLSNQPQQCIESLKRALQIRNSASDLMNISVAYRQLNDLPHALEYEKLASGRKN